MLGQTPGAVLQLEHELVAVCQTAPRCAPPPPAQNGFRLEASTGVASSGAWPCCGSSAGLARHRTLLLRHRLRTDLALLRGGQDTQGQAVRGRVQHAGGGRSLCIAVSAIAGLT